MLVEKRVSGIIRWLERLKKSYSSGAMESALMDAECAKADLENLRQVVWAEVSSDSRKVSSVLPCVINSLRILSLAVLIVVLAVVPLSREIPVPVEQNVETVGKGPIIVIRDYEPPKNTARADLQETTQTQSRKQTPQKRNAIKRTHTAQNTPATAAKPQPSTGTVPYDKVYSLIQTGQRALKNNSSVIKVQ